MVLRGNHERAKKSPELSGHKISGNSEAIQIIFFSTQDCFI